MRRRTVHFAVLGSLGIACNAGPTPRDASIVSSVPIYNTAAVVANQNVVLDVDDSPTALAALAAPDRDPRDRALDDRYQGADLLTFLDVRPGMRVLELAAGGGYLTELLARSVGQTGHVFANDPPSLLAGTRAADALRARLARPVGSRITLLERELASAPPDSARDLDVVYLALPYRTAEALGVDVDAMNRAAFAALAPGGTYVVLDFRPTLPGPVRLDLHALHAEESRNVRRQVEAAGFKLVTEGRFLRNDPNLDEWDAILAAHPTALEEQDRFLLKFAKP